jgi:DnaJ-class molecular chaperone
MQSGGSIPMDFGDLFAQFFGGGMAGGVAGGMGGGPSHFRVYQGGGGFGGGFPGGFSGFAQQPRSRSRAPHQTARKKSAPKEHQVKASDGSTLIQKGNNTYSELRLSFDKVMQGTTAKVATLSGSSVVKVPAGTCSGAKLRLRGKGARSAGKQGDHIITIQIDVPKISGDESKKLLVKLKKSIEKENK